jgi:hypothetical protein
MNDLDGLFGGAGEDRTHDLLTASQCFQLFIRTFLNSLEQLQISHNPIDTLVVIGHNGAVLFHCVQQNCSFEFCLFGTILEPNFLTQVWLPIL